MTDFASERLQDGVEQRGLAHARTAGDDQNLAGEGEPERFALALGEADAGPRLEPGDRLGGVDLRPGRPSGSEGAQPLGDGLLGPVQAGEEDAAPILKRIGHHRAALQLQRRCDPVG